MVVVVGAAGFILVPARQTRLPDAPALASSPNHSARNVANALGAFRGSLVIAHGWGYTAPALPGAVPAVPGLGIAALGGLI